MPLCWLLAALISVWVLWEHDIVESAEMTVCMCACVCEGVNSIPTVEMAFKCLSLCTLIVLQTHYLSAFVCVSTNICVRAWVCVRACVCVHVCVATNVFPSQSSNHVHPPTHLTLYLSVLILFSFIMLPFPSSCQRSLLRCNLAPAVL